MNALLLIDIQNDFLPGGALAVREGEQVIPVANRLMPQYELVVATRDRHPANHVSFASHHENRNVGDVIEWDGVEQMLWPDHCVEDTRGAAFPEDLHTDGIDHVIDKGTAIDRDSYSGFFDNGHRQQTGLGDYLKQRGVDEVHIMGLATDVCVKCTALDARRLGFSTKLVREGCRGVNAKPGDVDRALQEMESAGVEILEER